MNVGVKKATFEVYTGEIFVIMGLSGSGKSTLVRMLNQLIRPTAGHIYIDGEGYRNDGKRRVAKSEKNEDEHGVSEIRSIPSSYRFCKNVAYGLEIQGVPVEERERKSVRVLEVSWIRPS